MRTLIIGDIHGNLKALKDALKNANFNINNDRIICVGDYIDGWGDSFEVVRTLLEIKNQSRFENIFLMGNHDKWFLNILNRDFYNLRNEDYIRAKYGDWYRQGGRSTYESYLSYPDEFINIHRLEFFDQLRYYHQEDNNLFIHAGFHLDVGFIETLRSRKDELLWDRSLYRTAFELWNVNKNLSKLGKPKSDLKLGGFDSIFIGHTPTTNDGIAIPTRMANVINIDQGCKRKGILTIWELETGKYYQNIDLD